MNWLLTYIAIGWVIRAGMLLVILRRNFAPGAAIAWLLIVFLHPYIGLLLYLIFAQRRLGPGRVSHYMELLKRYAIADSGHALRGRLQAETESLVRTAANVGHMPIVFGNALEFFTESADLTARLSADIDSAASHVHLLYYIFAGDATGQRIAAALAKAVRRGVKCRVIVDEYASRAIFRREGFASRLREAGMEVVAALPSSPLRRRDLRNHRKLAIIDDRVAYAGSHNLINPDYGGRRGGPWVDLSARFTGPVVAEFAAVFVRDWAFETNQELSCPAVDATSVRDDGIAVQVVPSGPVSAGESFRRLLMGIIESAQREVILTTPYFVPDEPTVLALLTARDRGVNVTLVVPAHSDNMFTASASRAHFAALLEAGVSIFLYRPGLLHGKTITVDEGIAILGSANIDVRSFHLNFELSALVYDAGAARRLKAIQQSYIQHSQVLERAAWSGRPLIPRYVDSAISLISPLL